MTVAFPAPLGRADLTTTGETTIYTSTGVKSQVTAIVLHNRTASTVTVKVWHRLSAGATDNAAQFMDIALGSKETVQYNPKGMASGDSIRATADTANAVTVQVEGITES